MAARPVQLDQIPDDQWRVAERRLSAVKRLLDLPKLSRRAVEDEAKSLGLSPKTVYELLKRYRNDPTITSLIPRKRGRWVGTRLLSEAVETVINEAIMEFYLSPQKPSLRKLVAKCERRCKILGIGTVNYRTVAARVNAIPLDVQVRAREGEKAADDRFRPVVGACTADYALELVQYDHTLADVIVVDEAYRQPIQRPWLTLGIDIASRAIVGFYVTLEHPSTLSIAMALTHSVMPKAAWLAKRGIEAPWLVHGLPTEIRSDNGKDFHALAVERGCREYGIAWNYRPPATPHYGGHIERLIGTMMGEVHLLPGTTFSNIEQKGAYDSEKHACMTLPELETWLAIQILVYNGSIHSSIGVPPDLAYDEALRRRPTDVVVPKNEQRFFMDFLPYEMRKARQDGIQLYNVHYWDNVLSLWAGQVEQKMVVKYDPRDLSVIYLCDPTGKYWPIPYRDLRRPRITLWEHRRAKSLLRQRGLNAVNEQMLFDAVEAQRELVAEAMAKTKSARRQMQRTAYALGNAHPLLSMSDTGRRDDGGLIAHPPPECEAIEDKAEDWPQQDPASPDGPSLPFAIRVRP